MAKSKTARTAPNLRGYTSQRAYKGVRQLQGKDKAAVLASIRKARKSAKVRIPA
ncbi:MAG TPA: hypothetical protein VFW35_04840 [Sphingomicrobium sp.]|nr:hypothetical protein [Sphingomicrobium sp.]